MIMTILNKHATKDRDFVTEIIKNLRGKKEKKEIDIPIYILYTL